MIFIVISKHSRIIRCGIRKVCGNKRPAERIPIGTGRTVFADSYTEVDSALIPTGAHPSVENTPFDLREAREIGEFFGNDFTGYDHNFIISSDTYETFIGKKLALAAIAYGDNIKMSVYTDKPGIQFYTSNFLGGKPDFAGGIPKIKHGAFCLETQGYPNSPNCPQYPSTILKKGEEYKTTTIYKFI